MTTSCSTQPSKNYLRRRNHHTPSATPASRRPFAIPLRTRSVIRLSVDRVRRVSPRQRTATRRTGFRAPPDPNGRRYRRRGNLVRGSTGIVVSVTILVTSMHAYRALEHKGSHWKMAVTRGNPQKLVGQVSGSRLTISHTSCVSLSFPPDYIVFSPSLSQFLRHRVVICSFVA